MIDASGQRDLNGNPTGGFEVGREGTIRMELPTLRIRLFGELDLRFDETSLPPLESARRIAACQNAHLELIGGTKISPNS